MGTRADFYIGKGKDAQWIGSVAYDGYEWAENKQCTLMTCESEEDFKEEVQAILSQLDHATTPELGWPWPWDTSDTTDYQYWWNKEKSCVEWGTWGQDMESDGDAVGWPDMSDTRNNAMGKRSGILVIA